MLLTCACKSMVFLLTTLCLLTFTSSPADGGDKREGACEVAQLNAPLFCLVKE